MLRILILFLSFNLLSDVNKFIDASSKKYDQLALDLMLTDHIFYLMHQ